MSSPASKARIPSPRTASGKFQAELEHFRTQAESAVQFLAAYLAVNNAAVRDHAIQSALNASPLYWTTSQAALQKALFLALGRIFDQDSEHNIDKLIGIAQGNPIVFSKNALRQRKRGNTPTEPEWLDEYIAEAYEPTPQDFRELRKTIARQRKVYDSNYRPLRNSFFAHSEKIDHGEIESLFAQTNIGELQDLLNFLCNLHCALSTLFHDGRRLPNSEPSRMRALSERVTKEAEATLRRIAAGSSDKPRRRIRN